MEIDDRLACQIHGIISSDSDSDFDSRKDLDEEYQALKPPPLNYESIKDKIVLISQRKVVNVWEQRLQNKQNKNEEDNNKENADIENADINNEDVLNNNEDADVTPTNKKRKKKSKVKNLVNNVQEKVISGNTIGKEETQSKLEICKPVVDKTIAAGVEFTAVSPKKKNKKNNRKAVSNEDIINETNKQEDLNRLSALNKTIGEQERQTKKLDENLLNDFLTNDEIGIAETEFPSLDQAYGNKWNRQKKRKTFQPFTVDTYIRLMKCGAEPEESFKQNYKQLNDVTTKKHNTKKNKQSVDESTNISDAIEAAGHDQLISIEEMIKRISDIAENTSHVRNRNEGATNLPITVKTKKKKSKQTTEIPLMEHEDNDAKRTLKINDSLKINSNQNIDKEINEIRNDFSERISYNPPILIKNKRKRKKSKQTTEIQLLEHQVGYNVSLHQEEETEEGRLHMLKPHLGIPTMPVRYPGISLGDYLNDFWFSYGNNLTDFTTLAMEKPKTLYSEHLKSYGSNTASESFSFENEDNDALNRNSKISDSLKISLNPNIEKEIDEIRNDYSEHISYNPPIVIKNKRKRKKSKQTTEIQLIEQQVDYSVNSQKSQEQLKITTMHEESPEIDLNDYFYDGSLPCTNNSINITAKPVEKLQAFCGEDIKYFNSGNDALKQNSIVSNSVKISLNQIIDKKIDEKRNGFSEHISYDPPIVIKNKRKKNKPKQTTKIQLMEYPVDYNVNLHTQDLMITTMDEEIPELDLDGSFSCSNNCTSSITMPLEELQALYGKDAKDFNTNTSLKSCLFKHAGNDAFKRNSNVSEPLKIILHQDIDKEIEEKGNYISVHISCNPPIVKKNKKKRRRKKKSKQTTQIQLIEHQVGQNVNLHREETEDGRLYMLKAQEHLKMTSMFEASPEIYFGDNLNDGLHFYSNNSTNIVTLPVKQPETLYSEDFKCFNSSPRLKSFLLEDTGNDTLKQKSSISDSLKIILNQDINKEIDQQLNDLSVHVSHNPPILIKHKRKRRRKKSKQTTEIQLIEHQVSENPNLLREETNKGRLHSKKPEGNLEITTMIEGNSEIDLDDDFINDFISYSDNATDITAVKKTEILHCEDLEDIIFTKFKSRISSTSFSFEFEPNNAYKRNTSEDDFYKCQNRANKDIYINCNQSIEDPKDIQNVIFPNKETYMDEICVRTTGNKQISKTDVLNQKLNHHMTLYSQIYEIPYLKYNALDISSTIKNLITRTNIKHGIEEVLKLRNIKEGITLSIDKEINRNRLRVKEIYNENPIFTLGDYAQNVNKRNMGTCNRKNISLILNFDTAFKNPNNLAMTLNKLGYVSTEEVKTFIYIVQLYSYHMAYTRQIKNLAVCKKQDQFSLKDCVILFNFIRDTTMEDNSYKIVKNSKRSATEQTQSFCSTNQAFKKEFPSLDEVYGNVARQNRPQSDQNKKRSYRPILTNYSDRSAKNSTVVVKRPIVHNNEKITVGMRATIKLLTETNDCQHRSEEKRETTLSNEHKSLKIKRTSEQLAVDATNGISANKKRQNIAIIDATKGAGIKSENKKQSESKMSKIVDNSLHKTQPDVGKRNAENVSIPKESRNDNTNNYSENSSNSEQFNKLFDFCSAFFEETATIFEECRQTSNLIQERLAKKQNDEETLDLFMTINNSSLKTANMCMKVCNEIKKHMPASTTKSKKSWHHLGFPNDCLKLITPAVYRTSSNGQRHNESKKYDGRNNFEDKLGSLKYMQEVFLKNNNSAIIVPNQIKKPSSSSPTKSVFSKDLARKPVYFAKGDMSHKPPHFDNPVQRLAARKRRVINGKNKNVDWSLQFLICAICILVIEVSFLKTIRTLPLIWNLLFLCLTFLVRYIFVRL